MVLAQMLEVIPGCCSVALYCFRLSQYCLMDGWKQRINVPMQNNTVCQKEIKTYLNKEAA